jgi:hypothetical protein
MLSGMETDGGEFEVLRTGCAGPDVADAFLVG